MGSVLVQIIFIFSLAGLKKRFKHHKVYAGIYLQYVFHSNES